MGRQGVWAAAVAMGVVAGGVLGPAAARAQSTAADDEGRRLYVNACAACHGADARGAGPMAAELRVLPTDLTRIAVRSDGVFPRARIEQIIDGRTIPSHGTSEMPIWGDAFRDAEARITAIVRYLEAIQERASF